MNDSINFPGEKNLHINICLITATLLIVTGNMIGLFMSLNVLNSILLLIPGFVTLLLGIIFRISHTVNKIKNKKFIKEEKKFKQDLSKIADDLNNSIDNKIETLNKSVMINMNNLKLMDKVDMNNLRESLHIKEVEHEINEINKKLKLFNDYIVSTLTYTYETISKLVKSSFKVKFRFDRYQKNYDERMKLALLVNSLIISSIDITRFTNHRVFKLNKDVFDFS